MLPNQILPGNICTYALTQLHRYRNILMEALEVLALHAAERQARRHIYIDLIT